MEEKKFKLWAAHDKGDSAHTVWLYAEKPTLNATNDGYWSSFKDMRGCIEESFIPELTFENSPKEIEITIKVKQQESMKNVVIEIEGVRHVACKKGKGCESCSLAKYCPDEIGSPCNDRIDHFKLENK